MAMQGVPYRPRPAAELLRTNLMVWGLGGLILPFPCIKALDLLLAACGVT
jgi:K+-transporting ATPase ATPase B chain